MFTATKLKNPNPWCEHLKPSSRALLRIICFPYAGGSASVFRKWPALFPAAIDVCAVQLPGRGTRLAEPCLAEISSLANAALQGLLPLLDRPFVFFGHSMGALLAFECARLLAQQHSVRPDFLFVSGSSAPQLRNQSKEMHSHLPEKEFLEYVKGLNGTPSEVLETPELLRMLLPVLRADFAACETYTYMPGPEIGCPIAAFGGIRDVDVHREAVEGWKEHAPSGAFSISLLPGNHFFIHESETILVGRILHVLAPLLQRLQLGAMQPPHSFSNTNNY
jgi:medium-chain acyl-[acyl-carrier-protein] hydrolase